MAENVALLRLGTMGAGMAANLLKAGFSLSVYNRTAAKAQTLIKAGARFASTPAEAAKDASVIITMLSDDAASRELALQKALGPMTSLTRLATHRGSAHRLSILH